MTDVLGPLATALSIAEKLQQLASKVRNAETRSLIADLQLALAEVKEQLAEVQQENLDLRKQLRDAETVEDFRSLLELRGDLYWFADDPPEGRSPGPYCTACFDVRDKLVAVTPMARVMRTLGKYSCPACQAVYQG